MQAQHKDCEYMYMNPERAIWLHAHERSGTRNCNGWGVEQRKKKQQNQQKLINLILGRSFMFWTRVKIKNCSRHTLQFAILINVVINWVWAFLWMFHGNTRVTHMNKKKQYIMFFYSSTVNEKRWSLNFLFFCFTWKEHSIVLSLLFFSSLSLQTLWRCTYVLGRLDRLVTM